MAFQAVLTIAAILAAEWVFVHYTHALQIQVPVGVTLPPAKAAALAMANHEFLVIGMLIGAIIGITSSSGISDKTASGQLVSLLILPVPMIAGLALGLAIGGYRIPALASLAVVLAIGTYLRRFGPRGFRAGMLLFIGDFMGFFLHAAVTLGDLGWLAAEIGVGIVVAAVVRFALFYPRHAKALQRMQRSYNARARKVAALALELFDDPDHEQRDVRRLQRQLARLNEAALMIDAQLGDPGAVADGSSGQLLHQRLFDAELAMTNMARFAQALTKLAIPDACRAEIRLALLGIAQRDAAAARTHATRLIDLVQTGGPLRDGEDRTTVVILRRFASSVIALGDALTAWMSLGTASEGMNAFQPAVTLIGDGWLPGSAMVSAAASTKPGTRWVDRIRLAPHVRTAIQIGIAVGAATALGDVVSGRRFYWAVIAAFITFMGANNSVEQVRKALYRVLGTGVGIVLGSLLVHAVGQHIFWSLAVILAALFLGFYLMRINYAFMVTGITVMVSLLYVQLNEFSNSVLVLRLEETALGAAVASAVVLLVIPLRTRHVLRVAFAAHVRAVRQMAEHATNRLLGQDNGSGSTLRADARAVDAAYHALIATAQPLRSPFGSLDEETSGAMRIATASRYYCGNLVADIEAAGALDTGTRLDIKHAAANLCESLDAIESALTGSRDGIYTRSSALLDQAERRMEANNGHAGPAQLSIRDLKLIDGAMASLAKVLGLGVTSYDTDAARSQTSGGVPVCGHVMDSSGVAVGRAALTLIDGDGRQLALSTSDAYGAYEIYAPLVDGTYTLIVSAESHPPAASTVTVRHPGYGTGILIDVLLAGNGSLAGQ
ncbi:MAG TPA: FUSC family protein [Trebonia sp.]